MATRTLVESDTFDASLSANWTQVNTSLGGDITHNGAGSVRGTAGEQSGTQHAIARRNTTAATSAGSDQYAEVVAPVYVNIGASQGVGCVLCMSGANGTKSGYELWASAANSTTAAVRLVRWSSGTPTTVAGPANVTLAANDTLTLEKLGGQLRAYQNGTEVTALAYLDGSPINTGTWGLAATFSSEVTSWAGGTVTAGADTTPPTMTGTVTVTPGSTTASALCPTAADNVAVTAYEASIDGGTTWPYTSSTPTISLTGLTPSTSYTGRFRAKDAAGNLSTPVLVQAFTTSAAPATAVTLSGPSGGQVGAASSNFTVGANGAITGTVTVTPSDSGGGGTFSPTSVTISAGTPTATFTYTPGSAGAKTLTASATGLTSATAAYTATLTSATITIPGLAAWTGTVQAALTVPNVVVIQRSNRSLVLALTNQTTDSSGNLSITSGSLVAGVGYMVLGFTDDGASSFRRAVTAT